MKQKMYSILPLAIFVAVASIAGAAEVTEEDFSALKERVAELEEQLQQTRQREAALVGMLRSVDERLGALERKFPEGRTTKSATRRLRRGLQYMDGWLKARDLEVTNFNFMPEQGSRGKFHIALQIPDPRKQEDDAAQMPQNVASTLLQILGPRSKPYGLLLSVITPQDEGDPLNWGTGHFVAEKNQSLFVKGKAFESLEEEE
jgi:hypothetical protein